MRSSTFKFIDLPTSAERLGTTRNQMLQWVAEGRIRPFSGSGQQSVFRAGDVDKLADHPGLDTLPPALAPDVPAQTEEPVIPSEAAHTTRSRRRDPIKLVGTRISMDSRWAE